MLNHLHSIKRALGVELLTPSADFVRAHVCRAGQRESTGGVHVDELLGLLLAVVVLVVVFGCHQAVVDRDKGNVVRKGSVDLCVGLSCGGSTRESTAMKFDNNWKWRSVHVTISRRKEKVVAVDVVGSTTSVVLAIGEQGWCCRGGGDHTEEHGGGGDDMEHHVVFLLCQFAVWHIHM